MQESSASLSEYLSILEEIQRRRTEHALKYYAPYPKQRDFHAAGRSAGERLFLAGNQIGKTVAGGAEWAFHLIGEYPDWWTGAVFPKAPKLWCGGVTGESTRDNPQRILLGRPELRDAWGTGMIPKAALSEIHLSRGVPNSVDSISVKWSSGGDVTNYSSLLFKSYEKGREKWQGDTVDGVWFDEEPPSAIYSEGRTRTNNGQLGNFCCITFTPLLGMSEVVRTFLDSADIAKAAA